MQDLEFIKDRNKRATRRDAEARKKRERNADKGYSFKRRDREPVVDFDAERARGGAY